MVVSYFLNLSTTACPTPTFHIGSRGKLVEMSTTPPFRRPKLHLSLKPFLGSPQKIPYITPLATPGNTAGTYSPFRSAGLKPPTPYGGPMRFAPRPSDPVRHRNYTSFRIRRALLSRALWLSLVFVGLIWWWINGGKDLEKVRLRASGIGREIIGGPFGHNMRDMQFFPASNPKIHVCFDPSLATAVNRSSILDGGPLNLTSCAKMGPFLVNYPTRTDIEVITCAKN